MPSDFKTRATETRLSAAAPVPRLKLSVLERQGEAEQSAGADEGAKDTALLTLRPHQTCTEQLAD